MKPKSDVELAAGRVVKQTPGKRTLEQIAQEWVAANFPDFDDPDLYAICFTAGYRAARPVRPSPKSLTEVEDSAAKLNQIFRARCKRPFTKATD